MVERPTSIDAGDAGGFEGDFERDLRTVEEMDTPAGYKAELIRGKIVVSPWSKLRYKMPMRLLRKQLEGHVPEGHDADTSPFLFSFPEAERAFGPDLHVAELAAFDADGRHADAEALSLVAELTSASTRDADWRDKLETYGRQVPVYLILDMQAEEITAFWDPSPKGYRSHTTVSFGKPLHVPPPFDFDLDTTGFLGTADTAHEE
ncbi:Uma2 family endonuclease [Streptomyces sp. MUM 178J]|uniref:Uma2 family endonuclease n=1 Tax=Streptomyces sp. MUM 178J TaxID=2791991 RepID=UPI001F0347A7|nr:Uma2 family endonuclease [Streptomyces sp. MUM 178J]WRQ83298.1 Uma2 family endonuclease [Streptomyces sp. MUM 178J]